MAWPRFVWGETSRERELRAIADALQGDCDRKGRRIAVGEKQLAELKDLLVAEEAASNDFAGRIKTAEAERDAALAERDAAIVERNTARVERRGARLTLKIAACNLRRLADEIEPSIIPQDDRPATDCGAEGAGREPA